jgi:hypothetical protein
MTAAHEMRDPYFEVAVERSSGTAVVRVVGEVASALDASDGATDRRSAT